MSPITCGELKILPCSTVATKIESRTSWENLPLEGTNFIKSL